MANATKNIREVYEKWIKDGTVFIFLSEDEHANKIMDFIYEACEAIKLDLKINKK